MEEKDGKKFLLAQNGLMALPYYDFNYRDNTTRTIGTETIYENNYMHSKIRAWLNGYNYPKCDTHNGDTYDCADYQNKGFLQTAFTSVAQAKIATTTVDNSVESTVLKSNQSVCEDTDDKVFLLSRKEVTTKSYGFSTVNNAHYSRCKTPTDFALATGAEKASDGMHTCSPWWLRSPAYGYNQGPGQIWYIRIQGDILSNRPDSSYVTTVPALWVTP